MWTRYGQLSGMVEPLAGLLGAFAVVLAEPLLPYALAFAAGAMVYVVVDDIIPEAQVRYGRGTLGIDKEMKLLVWFGFSYTQEWKHKTSETRDFFDHLSLLHQWQWEVGLLDFHPGLRRDDVAGRGLGLTTHQHHESTSELFVLFFVFLIERDQMKCFNSTKTICSCLKFRNECFLRFRWEYEWTRIVIVWTAASK